MRPMRRLIAILLLATLSSWLAAPLLATSQTNLPSCCRREGKHHCMRPQTDDPGAHVSAKCLYTPGVAVFGLHVQPLWARGAEQRAELVFSAAAASSHTEPLRRATFSRCRQKRGPPSLLS